jgi:hypothetical protein
VAWKHSASKADTKVKRSIAIRFRRDEVY